MQAPSRPLPAGRPPPWRVLAATLLWIAAWYAGCAPAHAASCTYGEAGASFGNVSSFTVATGGITTSGNFNLTCGTGLLSVLGNDSLKATLRSTNNFTLRNLADSAQAVDYRATNALGATYSNGQIVIDAMGLQLLSVLTNRRATVPLNLTTVAANIPSGTYRDTLQLTWEYNFCDTINVLTLVCIGTRYTGTETRNITVELQVFRDCRITPGNLSFGSAALPSGFGEATAQMSIVCTTGMTYTVGMDAGKYSTGTRRQMANQTAGLESSRLAYDIYFGSNTQPWGTVEGSRVSSTQANPGHPSGSVANGTTAHIFPYRGRIYQDQSPPPPGSYTDTVIVNVQF